MVNYCSLKGILAEVSRSRWQGWLKRSSERLKRLTHGAAIFLGAGKLEKVSRKTSRMHSAIKNLVKRPIYSRNTRCWSSINLRSHLLVDLLPQDVPSIEPPIDLPPDTIRLPDDTDHQQQELLRVEEFQNVENKEENPQGNAENETNSSEEVDTQILDK